MLIKYYKLIIGVSLLILINWLIILASNIYLSFNEVYILEQDTYSFYNNNYLYLIIFYLYFFYIAYIFFRINVKTITTIIYKNSIYPHKNLNKILIVFVVALLSIAYLNLALSDLPPLLKGGYINRIGYLEETRLWSILKPFGAVLVIVPIILGYLNGHHFIYKKTNIFLYIILFIYIFYLLLIGQKFSGILQAFFYFYLPIIIYYILYNKNFFNKKIVSQILIFGTLMIFWLAYHYSNNPLSEKVGGAFQFLIYRIFALQGHLSWGFYNYKDLLNFEPSFVIHGMQNMMRTVGGPGVESMIERGVNFAGAFPTLYIMSFPIGINFLVIGLIYYLYLYLIIKIIKNLDKIYYIFYIYIFNYIRTFFSRASIEELFNFKIIGLLFMILFVMLLTNKYIKLKENG